MSDSSVPQLEPALGKKRFFALRRLSRELLPFKSLIILVLILGAVISSIQPLALKLSQKVIDELQANKDVAFFKWIPFALIGIFVVNGLGKYFYQSYRRYVAENIIIKLRTELFEKYLRFPMARLDSVRTGDFLASLQNDLAQLAVGLDTFCDLFKEPLIFVGLMSLAIYWNWRLALFTLIVAPLIVMLFSKTGSAVKRYTTKNLDHFADLVSVSQETLSGARVVKVFQLEEQLMAKFKALHDRYFQMVWKSIRVQELATPGVEFVGACLMVGVILYGRYEIAQGWLTTGQLIGFILALGLAQMPIKQMNNAWLKLRNAEAAAERIYAILDTPNPVLKNMGRVRKVTFDDAIRFEHVSLHYGDKEALSDVSFSVGRSECVAFVGPSGGGKSSIINLLPRLYEPSYGKIFIDGVEYRDIFLHDLRRMVSFVTQDTFLFNDSIYENIRYGRPEATRFEIEQAAEQAFCIPFIERNEKGFDTRIGDRGMCLSGGERQRIAIARSFLKGAPILVLDEATSNLDSESERSVQLALEKLMKGRTTFIVAHRLSSVRHASQIFVVVDGKIQASGSHQGLIASSDLYSRFFEMQTGVPL